MYNTVVCRTIVPDDIMSIELTFLNMLAYTLFVCTDFLYRTWYLSMYENMLAYTLCPLIRLQYCIARQSWTQKVETAHMINDDKRLNRARIMTHVVICCCTFPMISQLSGA